MFGIVNFLYSILFISSVPSGIYSGSESLLGQTINAVVDFKSVNTLDVGISGDFTLDCNDEVYSISGENILITNIDKTGDCAHDALIDNRITLKSIIYDSSDDTIKVYAKYSLINLDILLTKTPTVEILPIF